MKTITFNPETHRLAPLEPTDEMIAAAPQPEPVVHGNVFDMPHGWVINWPHPGGGTRPVYHPSATKPKYGGELDRLLTMYPVYTRPQPAAPSKQPLTNSQVRDLFLAHGFTIKAGFTDLMSYVYAAARAVERAHGIGASDALSWQTCAEAEKPQPEAVNISKLQKEAALLSEILVSMCEGSSPSPEELWDDNYQPADGDVYVHRAAIVLGLLAKGQSAPVEHEPENEPSVSAASVAQPAPAVSGEVPTGWKMIAVNDAFDPLIEALDRAESKGYLPYAFANEWESFDYRCINNPPSPWIPASTPPTEADGQVLVQMRNGDHHLAFFCDDKWFGHFRFPLYALPVTWMRIPEGGAA